MDHCYDRLKQKRKGITITDLYTFLITDGYLKFDEIELYNAILNDGRFQVEKESHVGMSLVKAIKRTSSDV